MRHGPGALGGVKPVERAMAHVGREGIRLTPHTRCRLIVNADDYGLTPKVNRGIEAAHDRGVVSSTSVMANQMSSEEAADLRRRYPQLGVGLHLTLTLGKPVCGAARVPSLVDSSGRFLTRQALVERLHAGGVKAAEVSDECAAQLERLRVIGVEPDHWNGHQHIQEWGPIGPIIAQTMTRCGIGVTRNSRRLLIGFGPARPLAVGRDRRRKGVRGEIAALQLMPDGLLEQPPRDWGRIAASLPAGSVVEALCHPGETDDDEVAALTPALVAGRLRDLNELTDARLSDALAGHSIQLVTFADCFGDSTPTLARGG